MIGKPEWFKRRKYGGWGLYPKTWQAWVYIAVFMGVLIIFNLLPFISDKTRITFLIIWIAVLFVDSMDIMIRMKQDERERIHEAISERNALWSVMIVLVIAMLYQIISSALNEKLYVDPVIIIALVVAVAVKALTNLYLDRKN